MCVLDASKTQLILEVNVEGNHFPSHLPLSSNYCHQGGAGETTIEDEKLAKTENFFLNLV